ncbi:MAG: ArnT family glycosyltransferase, partial [Nitrospinales bacterium]
IPLYFGNDIVPKYIHFAFSLLTAWLIFSYLKIRINTVYALVGALFFLSLPVIVKLSITVYVDLGLIFFSTCSLIYLLKWLENDFKFHFLIISAVSCGLALGTKYNGLITFFLLALFVPFLFAKYHNGSASREDSKIPENESRSIPVVNTASFRVIGYCAVFVIVALIVFSPWMIRNYIWTDNPVYPLYNGWFNPVHADAAESGGSLGHFAFRKIIFKESLWQTLMIPVRIFFEGQDDLPQYFDGKLNPFLFFLPFFAFFNLKNISLSIETEKKILITFTVLFFFFAFFQTDMRIRYIAPIIPPLVILAMYGLNQINTFIARHFSGSFRRVIMVTILAMVTFMLGINAGYIRGQFKYVDPMSYLSGRLDREAYIERYRPEYPTIQYANLNLRDNSKILCLYLGNRRYYSDKEMIFGDAFFRSVVTDAEVPENILVNLKRQGITHLLIRYDLLNQWSNRQLNDRNKQMLNTFFKDHAHRLLSKAGYSLYQLQSRPWISSEVMRKD